jgi:hypothetical protein
VTSPMDRLESFFIRTVEAAQQQAKSTSGAVSTTKISDFLEKQDKVESILDKLVSTSVTEESPERIVETEKVDAREEAIEPDKKLLSELAGSNVTSQTQKTSDDTGQSLTEKVEQNKSSSVEQINKAILDDLVGRPKSDEQDERKTRTGGNGDE